MNREEYSRTLRYMEYLREAISEAGSWKEENQLQKEYDRLWASIEPYATDKLKLTDAR